jgi:hypothetical protein
MNKAIWAVALKNSVAIICWTFLAYHFDKWWVALFGILFLTKVKWGKTMAQHENCKKYVDCTRCKDCKHWHEETGW